MTRTPSTRPAPRGLVSNGPFLEVKEVIGGYFLIECDSTEEALEIAQQCPHALHGIGPVEVREIVQMGSGS